MSRESFQERTEAPTPKRREESRKKGQVPRSQELNSAFVLLAGAAGIYAVAPSLAHAMSDVFRAALRSVTAPPVGVEGYAAFVNALGMRTLAGIAPFLLAFAATMVAVSAAQARGVLSLEPLKPQWSRLDPVRKIPQIWGRRALAELAKSIFKLTLVTMVVWVAARSSVSELSALSQQTPAALLAFLQHLSVRLLTAAGLAYLVLAAADYAYQLWEHLKELMMTREEIRQEVKEFEGDPFMKARRRTMARQLARRRMILSVPEADVVVTNPTQIAVALKYDPERWDAPVVLAMGERKLAQRIKEIAWENNIPTVENKPLARALLATARVGHPIPVELFVAVAEILAWVYRQASYRPGDRPLRWQGAEA